MSANADATQQLILFISEQQHEQPRGPDTDMSKVNNNMIPATAAWAINAYVGKNYSATGNELRKIAYRAQERAWNGFFEAALVPLATKGSFRVYWSYEDDFPYLTKWGHKQTASAAAARGIKYVHDEDERLYGFDWSEQRNFLDWGGKDDRRHGFELRKLANRARDDQWQHFFEQELAPLAEEGRARAEWCYHDEFPYLPLWTDKEKEMYTSARGIGFHKDNDARVFSFDWSAADDDEPEHDWSAAYDNDPGHDGSAASEDDSEDDWPSIDDDSEASTDSQAEA